MSFWLMLHCKSPPIRGQGTCHLWGRICDLDFPSSDCNVMICYPRTVNHMEGFLPTANDFGYSQ